MTEREWLASDDPVRMLQHIRSRASERKLLWFSVSCCDLAQYPDGKKWTDFFARQAEGLADPSEYRGLMGHIDPDAVWNSECTWGAACNWAKTAVGNEGLLPRWIPQRLRHLWQPANPFSQAQATSLRCIFGNPFRPVTIKPTWITPTIRELARTIYEEPAFDRIPILADALEEAGCDKADILKHCRSEGNVKGCWVIDLILDKK